MAKTKTLLYAYTGKVKGLRKHIINKTRLESYKLRHGLAQGDRKYYSYSIRDIERAL